MKAPNAGMRTTLATFNIHHGEGRDGRVDLARTAHAIGRTAAELVALQELDVGMARSGRVDQPPELARLTGLHVHFFPTIEGIQGGSYGIALACVDELEVRYEALPRLGREEARGALVASWRSISVVCAHLSQRREPGRAQVAALARLVATLPPPVVILGDLNARARALGPLSSAGFRPATAPGWRARWRQIDHVLAGPGLRLGAARLIPTDASDHRPLAAEVVVV